MRYRDGPRDRGLALSSRELDSTGEQGAPRLDFNRSLLGALRDSTRARDAGAAIDACCLIDLWPPETPRPYSCAPASPGTSRPPVEGEVRYRRGHDPAQPGQFREGSGATCPPCSPRACWRRCDPQDQQELDRFVHYAALFRSDGEAMCMAIAEQRRWSWRPTTARRSGSPGKRA